MINVHYHDLNTYINDYKDAMKELITTLRLIKSKKEKEEQTTKDIYEAYGMGSKRHSNPTIDTSINVEWTPLGKKGEHFKSLRLKQVNANRIELNKSIVRLVLSAVFTVIGLSLFIYGAYHFDENNFTKVMVTGPIIVGFFLAVAGIYYFIFPSVSTFDRRYDWYWRGRRSLTRAKEFSLLKKAMRLSNVAAIQVLTDTFDYDDQNSYTIWEINLVSKNGRRLNVIEIGNRTSILKDAQMLADFLNVPIWSNEEG